MYTETSGVSEPMCPSPIFYKYFNNYVYGTLQPQPFNSVNEVIAKPFLRPYFSGSQLKNFGYLSANFMGYTNFYI